MIYLKDALTRLPMSRGSEIVQLLLQKIDPPLIFKILASVRLGHRHPK